MPFIEYAKSKSRSPNIFSFKIHTISSSLVIDRTFSNLKSFLRCTINLKSLYLLTFIVRSKDLYSISVNLLEFNNLKILSCKNIFCFANTLSLAIYLSKEALQYVTSKVKDWSELKCPKQSTDNLSGTF